MGARLVQANQTHQMHRQFFFNGCAGERREGYFLHLHLRLFFCNASCHPWHLWTRGLALAVLQHVASLGLSKMSIRVAQVRMVTWSCRFSNLNLVETQGNQCVLPCILSWLPERYRSQVRSLSVWWFQVILGIWRCFLHPCLWAKVIWTTALSRRAVDDVSKLVEKISEHHFTCKVKNCEFFVCMIIRPWWSLSFFKLTVNVQQGLRQEFWCPHRSLVLFVLHRCTVLTLDHCSLTTSPYWFRVVAANCCQTLTAPFDLQLDGVKNCGCPSCVLMCSLPSWADRWKTWMLWAHLCWNLAMVWFWYFLASFWASVA